MSGNNTALVIRLCELLVNAAEVIKEQQEVILQLGGTCQESTAEVVAEIDTVVG